MSLWDRMLRAAGAEYEAPPAVAAEEPVKPTPEAHLRVPNEIWAFIAEYLSGDDIKCLRLSGSFFGRRVLLRLDRVFLSPNPQDIEVFLAIANNEVYRKRVVELVYDDVRLVRSHLWDDDSAYYSIFEAPHPNREMAESEEEWFTSMYENNYMFVARQSINVGREEYYDRKFLMEESNSLMPTDANLWYYQDLVAQQGRTIRSDRDLNVLLYGLKRFPCLKRITITPLAHGYPFAPIYETPMIRAFPDGFKYPLHQTWPVPDFMDRQAETLSWVSDSVLSSCKSVRDKWRGYCLVTRALAEHTLPHGITELAIEGYPLATGLSINLFSERGRDYDNFVKIISKPGFRRLDLSLAVGSEKEDRWRVTRSGLLKEALEQAPDLEFLSLATNVEGYEPHEDDFGRERLPLDVMFPRFHSLRHFRLWGCCLEIPDLIQFLNNMPHTLERADLAYLYFIRNGENHRKLLEELQMKLAWRFWKRRPNLRLVIQYKPSINHAPRAHWLDTEVDEYLYSVGPNPFGLPEYREANRIILPLGVLRDPCNPEYEKDWEEFFPQERFRIEQLRELRRFENLRPDDPEHIRQLWAKRTKLFRFDVFDKLILFMIILTIVKGYWRT